MQATVRSLQCHVRRGGVLAIVHRTSRGRVRHSFGRACLLHTDVDNKEDVPASARKNALDYFSLTKPRLSALVVLTAGAGYAMAPTALCDMTHAMELVATCMGTFLLAGAANTFNQVFERDLDSQMQRTTTRPMASGRISPNHGFAYGGALTATGTAMLLAVNPLTAALGASNVALYALAYTPLKQKTVWNTWVGAVVGAIPPMMGYAACTGQLDLQAALLGATLFVWQMPHFMALAFNNRRDYGSAGYHMMSVTDPARAAAVSLRHSAYLTAIPLGTTALGMTTPLFCVSGGLMSLYPVWLAYQFSQEQTDRNAKKVFLASLGSLPLFLGLMLLSKTVA